MNLKNGKKGVVIVYIMMLFLMLMLICIVSIIIFKMQISSKIFSIKKDLFYISQNCQMALDKNSLSYFEYKVDDKKINEIVKELLNKNYNGNVKLQSAKYNQSNNTINISVKVDIIPILNITNIESISIPITVSYKLKMMEVN